MSGRRAIAWERHALDFDDVPLENLRFARRCRIRATDSVEYPPEQSSISKMPETMGEVLTKATRKSINKKRKEIVVK